MKSGADYEKIEQEKSEERHERLESECDDSELLERQGANPSCDTIHNVITAINKKVDMLSDVVRELWKRFDTLYDMMYATAAVLKFDGNFEVHDIIADREEDYDQTSEYEKNR